VHFCKKQEKNIWLLTFLLKYFCYAKRNWEYFFDKPLVLLFNVVFLRLVTFNWYLLVTREKKTQIWDKLFTFKSKCDSFFRWLVELDLLNSFSHLNKFFLFYHSLATHLFITKFISIKNRKFKKVYQKSFLFDRITCKWRRFSLFDFSLQQAL
jgi:hypothetical protein